MKVDITISLDIDAADDVKLAAILQCKSQELPTKLQPYATASLTEYIAMILGQKVFKRGQDMLEYRLFLLISWVFNNQIPDEQDVCRLFQVTNNESRSLIRSIASKYQYLLADAIKSSLKGILQTAKYADKSDNYTATINSKTLIDELNKILAEIDGTLPSVQKKKNSVSSYELAPSSYKKLCAHFGIVLASEAK